MKRYPVVSTIIAFICVVILLKLGFWQLSRADEKREIALAHATRQSTVYPDILSALRSGGETDSEVDSNYRAVFVSGSLDTKRLLYWDNRVVGGKPGYEVLAVLHSDAGFVLVNFGWVQDKSYRQSIPQVNLPKLLTNTLATLYKPMNNVLITQLEGQEENWPKRIQQPDIEGLEQMLGVSLIPTLVYIKNSEDYGLINNFRPVTMSPEKHVGYAIQWFSLSVACLIVYLLALRKRLKSNQQSHEE